MKTHCKRGHELSGKNRIFNIDSNSYSCKKCKYLTHNIQRIQARREVLKRKLTRTHKRYSELTEKLIKLREEWKNDI